MMQVDFSDTNAYAFVRFSLALHRLYCNLSISTFQSNAMFVCFASGIISNRFTYFAKECSVISSMELVLEAMHCFLP